MKKILIVDDYLEVRELVDVTLRGPDFKILEASSGEEGISIAWEEKPDLIIMDIMMPGKIDWLKATSILKNDGHTRGTMILILTTKDQASIEEKGYQVGVDGYFIKPFSPLQLIKKVEELLQV